MGLRYRFRCQVSVSVTAFLPKKIKKHQNMVTGFGIGHSFCILTDRHFLCSEQLKSFVYDLNLVIVDPGTFCYNICHFDISPAANQKKTPKPGSQNSA